MEYFVRDLLGVLVIRGAKLLVLVHYEFCLTNCDWSGEIYCEKGNLFYRGKKILTNKLVYDMITILIILIK